MIIVYDGWPFLYDPNGPAALHLLALLAYLPAEVQAHIAVPGIPPAWLAKNNHCLVVPTPNTPQGRLRWEQRSLPGLAGRVKADVLHLAASSPALFGHVANVISPTEASEGPDFPSREAGVDPGTRASGRGEPGFTERLRQSLGRGGMERARAIFWPSDLPLSGKRPASVPIIRLPPVTHPAFSPPSMLDSQDLSALDLPETFVLYHGPRHMAALRRLLSAWRWAEGAIGEAYPLVLLGMEQADQNRLSELMKKYSLRQNIHPLAPVPLPVLAEIYRACTALFHPAPISPWGNPLRHALACERPIVAAENQLSDALVGPAAYLAPQEEPRALSAAIITVLVEEEVSERLILTARQRARWKGEDFSAAVLAAYQSVIGSS